MNFLAPQRQGDSVLGLVWIAKLWVWLDLEFNFWLRAKNCSLYSLRYSRLLRWRAGVGQEIELDDL